MQLQIPCKLAFITVKCLFACFLLCIINLSIGYSQTKNAANVSYNGSVKLANGTATINGKNSNSGFTIITKQNNGVTLLYLSAKKPINISGTDYAGIQFNDLPNLSASVVLWRYKPWNSWTKPIAITNGSKMPDWDVQFFYWKNKDNTYGAAMPLSGNGYRTTLGAQNGKWGSKSMSLVAQTITGEIPAMAVAFGKNPCELFNRIYTQALMAMGKGDNLRTRKTMPEAFNYIGWCTWNSSDLGKNLNEEHVVAGVKTFTDNKFKLGWVLIDDGWFQNKDNELQSMQPDPKKFPNGFKALNNRLKNELGIKYTGIWHAFDGYWNGIDPESALGKNYAKELFSWTQPANVTGDSTIKKTYHFIKPQSDSLASFYSTWYKYLKGEGFDFTKVDNQLVTERMAKNNYPVFMLSEKMHQALYKASDKYFNGAIINCMDMTAEAYLNFGSSAVARTVEDYFPYKKTENYNLQEGNAAAHVVQAIYNSIYFSQMVYPDFDMFQSHNPNAYIHAITRALNCGPIYLTDAPGQQNFELLRTLTYHDGRTIHSQTPLLPAADCLFQVQGKKIFKAFSKVGNVGLLEVLNAADADVVTGDVKAADANVQGTDFVAYEHFSKRAQLVKRSKLLPVTLKRLGYQLYYFVPLVNGFAPIGLTDKLNAPATILKQKSGGRQAALTLYEGGRFTAYSTTKPQSIQVNGKIVTNYQFINKLLTIAVADTNGHHPDILIKW